RQVLFKHLKVLAGIGAAMVVAADERRGLKAMDEGVRLRQPPVRIRLVPPAVEPNAPDLTVISQKLGELRIHVIEVLRPVPARWTPRRVARPAQRVIVR